MDPLSGIVFLTGKNETGRNKMKITAKELKVGQAIKVRNDPYKGMDTPRRASDRALTAYVTHIRIGEGGLYHISTDCGLLVPRGADGRILLAE